MLLAPLSVGFGFLNYKGNGPTFWYSISATYYASSKLWMIGLLFAAGITFLCYKGYDKIDDIITSISGICAINVAAFPCACAAAGSREGLFNLPIGVSNVIHCISAALLFVSFAVMIWFRFTLSGGEPTGRKALRNKIYKICAAVIAAFMISQILTSGVFHIGWMTVVNEAFMLTAFAIAWLVKGEAFKILND